MRSSGVEGIVPGASGDCIVCGFFFCLVEVEHLTKIFFAIYRESTSRFDEKLTLISCEIASTVASIARVPRVCSSSTALTVFSSDETFNTIT